MPFKLWTGLVRIPYNWEDDVHYLFNRGYDDLGIDLFNDGLNVLDFHPIHVFLNTDSQGTYNNAKTYYQNPEELVKLKNKKVKGTKDLLIDTLEMITKNGLTSYKMIEIYENYKNNEGLKAQSS